MTTQTDPPLCSLPLCHFPAAYGTDLCPHHHTDRTAQALQVQSEQSRSMERAAERLGMVMVVITMIWACAILSLLTWGLYRWIS